MIEKKVVLMIDCADNNDLKLVFKVLYEKGLLNETEYLKAIKKIGQKGYESRSVFLSVVS